MPLFTRNPAPTDLEETVRRRINERPAAVPAPIARQPQAAALEESPAQLLRLLARVVKRRGVQISTIRTRDGGFLVTGFVDGTVVQQWYTAQEVRRLGALHVRESGLSS